MDKKRTIADASNYPDETSVNPDTNIIEFFWVSRDSNEDGTLSEFCELWYIRPIRERMKGKSVKWTTADVSTDGWSNVGRQGIYSVAQTKIWCNSGAVPDTDRELLVVGRKD